MKTGDSVRIHSDNTYVDGAIATIVFVEPWGAHLSTEATKTGRYRASFGEMELLSPERNGVHKEMGYTGNACQRCGSFRMKRTGTCETCDDCGDASGGCS